MGTLWQDIKYGLRMLVKTPGFTVVVVLTLALGIGINTTIFSCLDRIFLRALPVDRPHELVTVKYITDDGGVHDTFNYPLYTAYRDRSGVFTGLAAYALTGPTYLGAGESTEEAFAMAVSDDYFTVLGVRPIIGRTFVSPDGQRPSTDPVVVISHTFWQRRFGSDRNVLGQTIRMKDHVLTIVGVAPAEFTGTFAGLGPAVYVPMGTWASMRDKALENRANVAWNLLGRLKPSVTRPQAQAALRVLAEQIHQVEPMNTYPRILVADGSRGVNVWTEEGLWLPFALIQFVTALVLVVACANVANMLLARGTTRQKEIAIRRAMGASRGHVIRQLLAESAILALLAGGCGALLAHMLSALLPSTVPILRLSGMPMGVDGRLLVLALLGSLGLVLFFGLTPALRLSRPNVMATLKDGAGVITGLTRRWSLRNVLVVTQVGVSVIVLALGVLCIRSVRALRVADPGYESARVLGVSVNLDRESANAIDVGQLLADLRQRVASLPDVRAVSLAARAPLTIDGSGRTGAKRIDDFQMPAGKEYISWEFFWTGPEYFRTLDIPLLRGREFTVQDGPDAPGVMIVNELMAQRCWPGRDPIGKRVTFSNGHVREVVGVVKAVKLHSIRKEPVPLSFWPLAQSPQRHTRPVLLVRTEGDHRPVASFIESHLESGGLDPVTCDVSTLTERAGRLLHIQRVIAALLNGIGAVGLLFVATGIAELMAFEVSQRTREIGIRMALGAQWRDVRSFVLRKGAGLTGIGLALGIGLSCLPIWITSRLVSAFRMVDAYFGVRLWDPLTYIGVAILVLLVMLGACWLPARRAARIDPMEALRYE